MTDLVLLTVDSLRADHVTWHGYNRETTPFLESMSEQAHTFRNAFANACYTRQSFPSMMTSEFPSKSREGGGLASDAIPIAQVLSSKGYTTGGFHSNPYLGPQFGYDRGFDMFYDSNTDPSGLGRLRLWVKEAVPDESIVYRTLEKAFAKTQEKAGVDPGTPSIPADQMTDEVIEWVESTTDGPRFLWTHYMDVHHPFTPPEEYQLKFREEPVSKRRAIQLQRTMLDKPETITEEDLKDLIDLYDAEIRFFDAEAKRLIESIQTHWGSDVVIIFTADHGEEFRDHGGFSHGGTLYDELLHVPLLLSDETDGGVYDEIVSLLDIAPTFLDYTGEKIPEHFQGESLKSLIDGEQRNRTYVVGDHGKTVAYRDEKWKYITGPDRTELYNIVDDSDEKKNRSETDTEVIKEIEATLEKHSNLGEYEENKIEENYLEEDVQDRLEQLGYLQE